MNGSIPWGAHSEEEGPHPTGMHLECRGRGRDCEPSGAKPVSGKPCWLATAMGALLASSHGAREGRGGEEME